MGYNTSLDNISAVLGPLIGTFFVQNIRIMDLNLYGLIPSLLSVVAFVMAFIRYDIPQIDHEKPQKKDPKPSN